METHRNKVCIERGIKGEWKKRSDTKETLVEKKMAIQPPVL
jgi:hypothetical protein